MDMDGVLEFLSTKWWVILVGIAAIFGGTNHYDAKGHKIGYSRPGILSDDVQVHYDTHHNKVGTSRVGITGYENHYDNHGHKVGYTRENIFFGKTTKLNNKK